MNNQLNKKFKNALNLIKDKQGYIKCGLAIIFVIIAGIIYTSVSVCAKNDIIDVSGNDDESQGSTVMDLEYDNEDSKKAVEKAPYVVYVCGAVVIPGVYELEEGARIYQAIELAGGFAEEANEAYLNLVDIVVDGQKIYVPYKDEKMQSLEEISAPKVNINTATKEQLMTLPGIGEAKALDIINYRQSKGKFNSIEDIMNISGIKESAFSKIKDLICV